MVPKIISTPLPSPVHAWEHILKYCLGSRLPPRIRWPEGQEAEKTAFELERLSTLITDSKIEVDHGIHLGASPNRLWLTRVSTEWT